MLILFDIDGTLLTSDGAGRRSMEVAASEMAGRPVSLETISFAGSLDPVIWRDVCAQYELDDGDAGHARFRSLYARHFLEQLPRPGSARALPGVARLLDQLELLGPVVLGLLTGNYPETGRAKIDAAGLRAERFGVAAWGDDGPARPDLVPVAVERCLERTGRAVSADEIVIVGDTPGDVATARAHGCRCLAVATGLFSIEQLQDRSPTRVVGSLEDTGDVLDWLLGGGDRRP